MILPGRGTGEGVNLLNERHHVRRRGRNVLADIVNPVFRNQGGTQRAAFMAEHGQFQFKLLLC